MLFGCSALSSLDRKGKGGIVVSDSFFYRYLWDYPEEDKGFSVLKWLLPISLPRAALCFLSDFRHARLACSVNGSNTLNPAYHAWVPDEIDGYSE